MPDPGDDTEDTDDADDDLATRPHRKLELFEAHPDDTHDDPSDFENQLTPPPKFLKPSEPPEPTDDDATRPHVRDDEGEIG